MNILEELDAAEKAATIGPWGWVTVDSNSYEVLTGPLKDAQYPEIDENLVLTDGSACGEYAPDITSTSPNSVFIVLSRNNMRPLLDLAFAAKNFHDNFNKYWTGYPSKIDWPELHVLRQKLETLMGSEEGTRIGGGG